MTKKKIICRISNGFGNQMFMYAASYSFSKQLNYKLFLDTFSGINQDIKKSLKKGFKHYKPQYELSVFNLTANFLPKNLTFDSFIGNLKMILNILNINLKKMLDLYSKSIVYYKDLKTNNNIR